MRTEEEIRLELAEYEESFAQRDMSNPLDRMVGGFDKVWIEALKWVLNE